MHARSPSPLWALAVLHMVDIRLLLRNQEGNDSRNGVNAWLVNQIVSMAGIFCALILPPISGKYVLALRTK